MRSKVLSVAVWGLVSAGAFALAGCDVPVTPLGDVLDTTRVETSDPLSSNAIDLLFVIDNSNSMAPFQQELVARFEELINVLAGLNADFHIGVITTAGNPNQPDGGGKLQDRPYACRPSQAPADLEYCSGISLAQPFLTAGSYKQTAEDGTVTIDETRLASDFRCIASVGVCGDPNEAGVDALAQALSPSTASRPGVLDTVNRDFIRPDAYLGVIFIADEDDCSFGGTRTAASAADCYGGDLRSQMTNVQDVYDLLVSLKDGDPNRVFVAGIIGPDDGVDLVAGVPYDPNRIGCVPELTSGAGGPVADAFDGERYRQLLELFGRNGVEQSICEESFTAALSRIGRVIRDNLDINCLQSPPETCLTNSDCPEGVACINPGLADGNKYCADFEVLLEVSSAANPFSFNELAPPGPAGQSEPDPGAQYLVNYESLQCPTGVSFSFSGSSRPGPGSRFRATYPILIDPITPGDVAAEEQGNGQTSP
jgi:hypothetical protein